MPSNSEKDKLQALSRLLTIMDELRTQCPWDKKQTTESLRHLTIEEVFELSDAILDNDPDEIRNELGDLLLHIVFYARIGDEKGQFDIADVANQLCEKLTRRHPHIYGDTKVSDENEVKENWEKIKLREKGNKKQSVLGGVPRSLPAMIKALRIQDKARGVGFDWPDIQGVIDKIKEEIDEFEHAENEAQLEDEFGDVLFSLINYARAKGINAEDALEKTNKKFMQRFAYIEAGAEKEGKSIDQLSLMEMEKYWQAAKGKKD